MKLERLTRQRRFLLDELRRLDTHPTADELYALARRRMPSISLGTVYRNLENFARQGLILKIESSGDRMRFDGNTGKHLHFRCDACGGLSDVFTDRIGEIESLVEALMSSPRKLSGYYLELKGVCGSCSRKRAKAAVPGTGP